MEITEVKVFPIQEEKLKAFVSIVFDHCFMVNDIKIIQGRDGLFISMPSRKKKNGEFKDVAHPLNNETRRMIEDKVLGEYERILVERGGDSAGVGAVGSDSAFHATPPPTLPPLDGALLSRPMMAASDAPISVAGPVAAPPPPAVAEMTPPHEKTMEEIEEMHLRDSFWTVT